MGNYANCQQKLNVWVFLHKKVKNSPIRIKCNKSLSEFRGSELGYFSFEVFVKVEWRELSVTAVMFKSQRCLNYAIISKGFTGNRNIKCNAVTAALKGNAALMDSHNCFWVLEWKHRGVIWKKTPADYSMELKEMITNRRWRGFRKVNHQTGKWSRTNQVGLLTLFVFRRLCLVVLFNHIRSVFLV